MGSSTRGSSANVRSVQAIKDFRLAYGSLIENAKRALDAMRMDIRRFVDWLETDQVNHWKSVIKQLRKELGQAKNDLNRKRLSGATSRGHKPDLTEAKMLVRNLQQRIEIAEGKLRIIAKWKPEVERAIRQYEGQARQLADMLGSRAPTSMALLERMIRSLESYARLAPPTETARVTPPADGSSDSTESE